MVLVYEGVREKIDPSIRHTNDNVTTAEKSVLSSGDKTYIIHSTITQTLEY